MSKSCGTKTDDYGPGDALIRKGLGTVMVTNHGSTDSSNIGALTGALIGAELGGVQGAIEGSLIGGIID